MKLLFKFCANKKSRDLPCSRLGLPMGPRSQLKYVFFASLLKKKMNKCVHFSALNRLLILFLQNVHINDIKFVLGAQWLDQW